MNEEVHEIELTDDLLDFAKRSAIIEAKKHIPDFVEYDDIVQEVWLKLLSKPPKYDPSKGASVKTLIYTIVQRIVLKHIARETRSAARFKQMVKPETGDDDDREAALDAFSLKEAGKRHHTDLTTKCWTTDDVMEFIDDEESRELCRVVMECEGNKTEAAKRLGVSEGTVRYRFNQLVPKLLAAGFDPYSSGEGRWIE